MHLYCDDCIRGWLKIKPNCPTCRQDLNPSQLQVSGFARNFISNQKVRCVNREQGCVWVDTIGPRGRHVDNHIALHCPYEMVSCRHDPTHFRGLRKDMEAHLLVCDNRLEKCPKCNEDIQLREMGLHLQTECPEMLMPCPNGCAEYFLPTSPPQTRSSVKRKKMPLSKATVKKWTHSKPESPSITLSTRLQLTNVGCAEMRMNRWDDDDCVESIFTPVSVLRRGDLALHRREQCPLQIINCPFVACGCNLRLPRIDMRRHVLQSVTTHHNIMNATLISLKRKLPHHEASEEESEEEKSTTSLPGEEEAREEPTIRRAPLDNFEWRQRLDVGHCIDYLVRTGVWKRVYITTVRRRDTRIIHVRVRYENLQCIWIPINSGRIQLLGTRTTGTVTILS